MHKGKYEASEPFCPRFVKQNAEMESRFFHLWLNAFDRDKGGAERYDFFLKKTAISSLPCIKW